MRLTVVFYAFLVGATLISNVDCTLHHLLGGLLSGIDPLHLKDLNLPGFELFDEFFNVFHRVFGGTIDGFNVFLDDFIRGIPALLRNLFGVRNLEEFLGPLSQIPDDADLPALLGDKFKGQSDIIALLVQLSKKFCLSGKCDKFQLGGTDDGGSGKPLVGGFGGELQKSLADHFGGFNHKLESGLGDFNSAFEGLVGSLGNGKHNDIFEMFSKLPDDFNPARLLGKHESSHVVDGILSRKDILPILTQFAKTKCSEGCGKS